SGNTSSQNGGAVWTERNTTIVRSTFTGNKSLEQVSFTGTPNGEGGAVWTTSTVTVGNSTFTANAADTEGGGLWLGRNTSIANTTIAGNNSAGSAGSGIYVEDDLSPTVTLFDTIVAGNEVAPGISNVDGVGNGMAANSAYNIIGDNGDTGENLFVNSQNHNQV